jgi:hypothetical protein
LLAWFCDYEAFGSWDPDHLTAIVFPKVPWSKIVSDPAKYLDAQWHPYDNFAKYIEPWKHCEFKKARLLSAMGDVPKSRAGRGGE